MTYAIKQHTQGAYACLSEDIQLPLLDKTIRIDNLVLTRIDTANVSLYYDVKIPKVHLSIDSWQELRLDNRLAIDSFSAVKPTLVIHEYRVHKNNHQQARFQTPGISKNLQTALDYVYT